MSEAAPLRLIRSASFFAGLHSVSEPPDPGVHWLRMYSAAVEMRFLTAVK